MLCLEHSHDIPRADGILCEGKGAMLLHFPSGAEEGRPGRRERERCRTLTRLTPIAERAARLSGAPSNPMRTFTGRSTELTTAANVVLACDAGRVENIGARFLIGLETLDRVSEVTPADQVVLSSCSERERKAQGARTLSRGADSFSRKRFFIDGAVRVPGRVLDRTPTRPRLPRADGFGDDFRGVCKAILKINADGQIGGLMPSRRRAPSSCHGQPFGPAGP